jgi:hypothetical protein
MLRPFNPKASVFGIARLFLVWVCCTLASLASARAMTERNGAGPNHFVSQFTIVDLDGDETPDLAVVQVVVFGSPKSKYSIRFEFSGGTGAAVGIEAPLGGLRIDWRDVNGDDRKDLIISTLTGSEIVAVLVNEGGGNFVVAKPSQFPSLEQGQRRVVRALGAQMGDERSLLQSRAAFGEEAIGATGRNVGAVSHLLPKTRRSGLLQRAMLANLGRSPPAVVCA